MNSLPSFDEDLGHKPTVAQRESRIGSIYEKYLYDPKDLKSADPVIRALARKASQDSAKSSEPRADIAGSTIRKRSPSNLAVASGTTTVAGVATGISASASVESAWGGFSALVEESSDFDDASDDEGATSGRTKAVAPAATLGNVQSDSSSITASDSWGTRMALAVGQRPPDGASQNPPSLKLLGLRGQRPGGAPLSYSSTRQQPGLRILNQGDQSESASRAASTVEIGMQAAAGTTVAQNASQRSQTHKALTAQLGLDTPLPPPKDGASEDYFASCGKDASSTTYALPQQPRGALVRSPATSGSSSTTSSPRSPSYFDSPNNGLRSLISPPISPSGSGRQGSPHSPKPLLLCQGLDSGSPLKFNLKPLPPALGFSEASHTRKQSLLRRSVAFVTGSTGDSQQETKREPALRPDSLMNKGKVSFRKSMNLLVGKSTTSEDAGEKLADEDEDSLAPPRVRWFSTEEMAGTPKERKYLCPRDDGEEWDADGAAADFWRRFEIAQKKAEMDNSSSVTFRQKLESRRKVHLWSVAAGGALIVALIIAIIVWRTNTSSATDRPTAVNAGEYSGATRARRALIPTATQMARRSHVERRDVASNQLWKNAQVQNAVVVEPVRRGTASSKEKREARRELVKRHSQMRRRLHQ